MSYSLTDKEFADLASKMKTVVDAIFACEVRSPTETVLVSRPIGLRESFGLKKLPSTSPITGIRFAWGVKDMEGLVYQGVDNQSMVAVKVHRLGRHHTEYESYTVAGYVSWIIDGRHSHALKSREIISRAMDHLQMILPKGHKLKVPQDI